MLGFWLAIKRSSLRGCNGLSLEAGREWVEKGSLSPGWVGTSGIRIHGSEYACTGDLFLHETCHLATKSYNAGIGARRACGGHRALPCGSHCARDSLAVRKRSSSCCGLGERATLCGGAPTESAPNRFQPGESEKAKEIGDL